MKTYSRDDSPASAFADPSYGLTRRLPGMDFDAAVTAVTAALADQGFGVLTTIDLRSTLRAKLGVEFRDYVILGACNPGLAHRALSGELAIGLLLPCNVVVTRDDDGMALVSAIDPARMFSIVGNPEVGPIAEEVGVRLRKALDAVKLPVG